MPGYRDYERALAAVVHGTTPENKGVFDVLVDTSTARPFGISCKMTRTPPTKHSSSFMELSNSAALFRQHLLQLQIHWSTEPTLAGPAIIDLVTSWHLRLEDEVDLEGSKYSVLAHDSQWKKFQILCFPLDLQIAKPKGDIDWRAEGASLNGYVKSGESAGHRLWQWYPNSGGQLKYFPPLTWADWVSQVFELEDPAPVSLKKRAREYFPELWPGD